jgi:hypothetical protein
MHATAFTTPFSLKKAKNLSRSLLALWLGNGVFIGDHPPKFIKLLYGNLAAKSTWKILEKIFEQESFRFRENKKAKF